MQKSILIALPAALLIGYFLYNTFAENKTETVEDGKRLFSAKCSSCHNKDMIHRSTGPALGCIEGGKNPRTRLFLKYFIRNSSELIREGNKAANCMYDRHNKCNMTLFPNLSDSEINSILDYIKAETQAKNICKYDAKITGRDYDCNLSPNDFIIDTAQINIVNYVMLNHENLETGLRDENDVVRNIQNWKTVNPFEINIDTDAPETVKCYVFSTQKNGFYMRLIYDTESDLFTNYTDFTDDSKVYMPINQGVFIVAFAKQKDGQYVYAAQKTTIQANNRLPLGLKPVTIRNLETAMKGY